MDNLEIAGTTKKNVDYNSFVLADVPTALETKCKEDLKIDDNKDESKDSIINEDKFEYKLPNFSKTRNNNNKKFYSGLNFNLDFKQSNSISMPGSETISRKVSSDYSNSNNKRPPLLRSFYSTSKFIYKTNGSDLKLERTVSSPQSNSRIRPESLTICTTGTSNNPSSFSSYKKETTNMHRVNKNNMYSYNSTPTLSRSRSISSISDCTLSSKGSETSLASNLKTYKRPGSETWTVENDNENYNHTGKKFEGYGVGTKFGEIFSKQSSPIVLSFSADGNTNSNNKVQSQDDIDNLAKQFYKSSNSSFSSLSSIGIKENYDSNGNINSRTNSRFPSNTNLTIGDRSPIEEERPEMFNMITKDLSNKFISSNFSQVLLSDNYKHKNDNYNKKLENNKILKTTERHIKSQIGNSEIKLQNKLNTMNSELTFINNVSNEVQKLKEELINEANQISLSSTIILENTNGKNSVNIKLKLPYASVSTAVNFKNDKKKPESFKSKLDKLKLIEKSLLSLDDLKTRMSNSKKKLNSYKLKLTNIENKMDLVELNQLKILEKKQQSDKLLLIRTFFILAVLILLSSIIFIIIN